MLEPTPNCFTYSKECKCAVAHGFELFGGTLEDYNTIGTSKTFFSKKLDVSFEDVNHIFIQIGWTKDDLIPVLKDWLKTGVLNREFKPGH